MTTRSLKKLDKISPNRHHNENFSAGNLGHGKNQASTARRMETALRLLVSLFSAFRLLHIE